MLQPFDGNYVPLAEKLADNKYSASGLPDVFGSKDYDILENTLALALNVLDLENTASAEDYSNFEDFTSEKLSSPKSEEVVNKKFPQALIHKIAGPPYLKNKPKLLNSGEEDTENIKVLKPVKRPQNKQKSKGKRRQQMGAIRSRIRRQRLKMKILQELQRLEAEEIAEIQNKKYDESLEKQSLETTILSGIRNIIGLERNGYEDSGSGQSIFDKLRGDQSLSRQDFLRELTTWFRRAIWFLAFTGAYTLSPTILIIAVIFSIAFELALNVDLMQQYMNRMFYTMSRSSSIIPGFPGIIDMILPAFSSPEWSRIATAAIPPQQPNYVPKIKPQPFVYYPYPLDFDYRIH